MDIKSEKLPLLFEQRQLQKRLPSTGRKTSILLACLYLHFMSLGFSGCLGVIYVELIRYFETSHSLAALVQSCFTGLTFIGGFLFSTLVNKFGVGRPVIVAGVVCASSFFISTLSWNIYLVIISVGITGGLCMGVTYLCGFVAVGWTFVRQRKTALAALTMAVAVSQSVSPNIVGALTDTFGWHGTMILSSGLMLNIVPCGLFLYQSREFFHKTEQNGSEKSTKICACSSKADVALFIFITTCSLLQSTGAVQAWFLVDIAEKRGNDRQMSALVLTIMGIGGLLGRAIGAIFLACCPNVRPSVPLAIAFYLFGIAHFLVIVTISNVGLMSGAMLRGLSVGFLMGLQPVMILELRGIEQFPKVMALTNFLMGIVQITYSYIAGWMTDVTGDYDLVFYIATAAAGLCGTGMIVIKLITSSQLE